MKLNDKDKKVINKALNNELDKLSKLYAVDNYAVMFENYYKGKHQKYENIMFPSEYDEYRAICRAKRKILDYLDKD